MAWRFFRSSADSVSARWMWAHEDESHGITRTSSQSFESYSTCLADAAQHGYGHRLRRHEPPLSSPENAPQL
jgi:hypothetical protein